MNADDHRFMARAIALARRGVASTDPNPAVGCVIVQHGAVVGEGHTQRAGGNHAEIEALDAAGDKARGATVYVSLEPCAHAGRTGPCAEALIQAGVSRVIYAAEDPHPEVSGAGARRLLEAGIEVASPLLAAEAEAVNRGFFSRIRRARPWVRLKMAASLDGRTALSSGASQWITGELARRDVHRWRAQSSAVMTGIGTVLADDPALTARTDEAELDVLQPKRVIVDSSLRTPPTARTLGLDGEVIIFTGKSEDQAQSAKAKALKAAGASIETVPAEPECDLGAVLARLAELEINDLWLEAGPGLSGAMLTAGLVDEIVLYLAPCLLGHQAHALLTLAEPATLDRRLGLEFDDLRMFGQDLRIIARPVKT